MARPASSRSVSWFVRTARGVLVSTWLVACADGIAQPIRLAATDARGSEAGSGVADSGTHEDPVDPSRCGETEDWAESDERAENALFEAIDQLRDREVRCGDREYHDLRSLRFSPELRCSARLHSLDMAQRSFAGRTNPDGEDPGDRMRAAGFHVEDWSESIVIGEADPGRVLEQLLGDWDDCMNVATDELTYLGVGHHEDLWTLDFARD